MGKLVYSMNSSLDGYMSDAAGSIDWGEPSDELHAFFNDLMRPIGTHLYGRAMYEVMSYWETAQSTPDRPRVEHEFAEIWQSADKVVFSTTLNSVSTARTRLERTFDAAAIRTLKNTAEKDINVGGALLAGEAFRHGLVDECHLVVHPISLGGGQRCLPDDQRIDLELLNQRRFDDGVVHLHYRVVEPILSG